VVPQVALAGFDSAGWFSEWFRMITLTPAQCRAARGLLAWTQYELADRAGVGTVTIHQLEAGVSEPRRATLNVIRQAFEAAGVEFIAENGAGEGVRFRKPQRTRPPKPSK
jgi:transcriptional regulator with XRE-family HTH domain